MSKGGLFKSFFIRDSGNYLNDVTKVQHIILNSFQKLKHIYKKLSVKSKFQKKNPANPESEMYKNFFYRKVIFLLFILRDKKNFFKSIYYDFNF